MGLEETINDFAAQRLGIRACRYSAKRRTTRLDRVNARPCIVPCLSFAKTRMARRTDLNSAPVPWPLTAERILLEDQNNAPRAAPPLTASRDLPEESTAPREELLPEPEDHAPDEAEPAPQDAPDTEDTDPHRA